MSSAETGFRTAPHGGDKLPGNGESPDTEEDTTAGQPGGSQSAVDTE
jgi:hypothetical protein